MNNIINTILRIWIVAFIALSAVGCSKQIHTADIDTSYYRINNRKASDNDLDKFIEPYRKQLEAKMNEVIAYNVEELTKARPNSNLGNWFADVLLEEAESISGQKVDIAFQNYGGIRVPFLKQGDITVGNIYELMPFDNMLVLLKMDGKLLQKLLDRISERGGWPISGTLNFTINGGKAVDVKIHGKPLDHDGQYTIAIADYIANGGDNCFFLEKADREDFEVMIRDVMIDHLRNLPADQKKIKADNTLRIKTQEN